MGKSINKVILIGNIGKALELKKYPDGTPHVQFPLATNESWKAKGTGEINTRTDWHTIKATGKVAEILAQYVKVGAELYVEGTLRTDKYEKDGEQRYATYVKLEDWKFLGAPNGEKSAPGKPADTAPKAAPAATPPPVAPVAPEGPPDNFVGSAEDTAF